MDFSISSFNVLFGDKTFSCSSTLMPTARDLVSLQDSNILFKEAQKLLQAKVLILPRQVHTTEALIIKTEDDLNASLQTVCEADIVITTLPTVAVGVLTADCLPMLLYDSKKKVIAAVHAGWRGSVNNIAKKAVEILTNTFQADLADLHVYFGPCAHQQSYQASPELIDALKKCSFQKQVLIEKEGRMFFNLPLLNQLNLYDAGIIPEHINQDYCLCTITHNNFWSYRRDGETAGRQLSAIALI